MNFLTRSFKRLTAVFRKDPDFIIIGVQKGGTTSLFHYLAQHPDLMVPTEKELHFFDVKYKKGLHWYKSFFPLKSRTPSLITGEATPFYFFHPLVPDRIHRAFPDVKLIVLLRNPINRAYSHYQMAKRYYQETASCFEDAIAREAQKINVERNNILKNPNHNPTVFSWNSYLSRGHYYEQFQQWFKYFPRNQFLILQSEVFFTNPESELQRVYSFLGVAHHVPKDLKPKNMGNYLPIKSKTKKLLDNYFKEKNEKLEELLNIKFKWEKVDYATS